VLLVSPLISAVAALFLAILEAIAAWIAVNYHEGREMRDSYNSKFLPIMKKL
jgi:hypothetical protein